MRALAGSAELAGLSSVGQPKRVVPAARSAWVTQNFGQARYPVKVLSQCSGIGLRPACLCLKPLQRRQPACFSKYDDTMLFGLGDLAWSLNWAGA